MQNIQQMLDVIRSLKMSYGSEFFSSLTLQLHNIIEADFTFIARINRSRNVSRSIAFVTDEGVQEDFEYDLKGTPCSDVSHDTVCVYPSNVCEKYPLDQLLIDMDIRGYVGTPLHDSNGNVVGIIVGLYKKTIAQPELVTDVFQFFEGRISAELERSIIVEQLKDTNASLEQIVDARTAELTQALDSLESAQKKMIEHEKQASLSRLVVGVAHEINTPLGVGILAGTTLANAVEQLAANIDSKRLTKLQLTKSCEEITEASDIINFNLVRAAELVSNFKQISSDHINDEKVLLDMNQWLPNVLGSLSVLAISNNVNLSSQISNAPCLVEIYPAKLYQVISNLVTNAVRHGFDDFVPEEERQCMVNVLITADEVLEILVSDNGKGIENKTLTQVYEPFFTTKRGKGDMGLGMSIVYSLVTGPLNGNISITSKLAEGTRVVVSLPMRTPNNAK